jgi:hypothetical protein
MIPRLESAEAVWKEAETELHSTGRPISPGRWAEFTRRAELEAKREGAREAVERIRRALNDPDRIPDKERYAMYPGFIREAVLNAILDEEAAR